MSNPFVVETMRFASILSSGIPLSPDLALPAQLAAAGVTLSFLFGHPAATIPEIPYYPEAA